MTQGRDEIGLSPPTVARLARGSTYAAQLHRIANAQQVRERERARETMLVEWWKQMQREAR